MKLGKYTQDELVSMIQSGREESSFEEAVLCLLENLRPVVKDVFNSFEVLAERNILGMEGVLDYTVLVIIETIEAKRYKGVARIDTYARVIAKNKCLREKNKLVRRIDSPMPYLNGSTIDENSLTAVPIDTLLSGETEEEVLDALESELPAKLYKTFKAIAIDGKKYAEYADETGIEINALKTRVSRAKAIIKKHLKEKLFEIIFSK